MRKRRDKDNFLTRLGLWVISTLQGRAFSGASGCAVVVVGLGRERS